MKFRVAQQRWPILITAAVCLLLYIAGGLLYDGFSSKGVAINFFSDNAFLGIAAVGMTFVILSGGIDLSVGAVIGCGAILTATFVQRYHLPPALVIPLILLLGTVFGLAMGCIIHFFALPPFLVTLAGLFFCRGTGLLISSESISITHPFFQNASGWKLPLGGGVGIPLTALILVGVVALAGYALGYTRFGRNTYALGGNETSAILMGLPVAATRIGVYGVSGFSSSLAAIVYAIYTASGNATAGTGLELDAIAAVVVGGTLLSGGVGTVPGTLIGVLIFGIIQTGITFQGTLSSWWTKIAIGLLLLIFIVLQRLLQKRITRSPS